MAVKVEALNVIEFGPTRAIGLALIAKGGIADFPALWQKQLFPRAGEIARPPKAAAFGVCRCVPAATDGTFEYLALLEATAEAPLPAGMVELTIPRSHYAVFQAPSLQKLGETWRRSAEVIEAQTQWKACCGRDGCQCAEHPSFEYHAWDSHQTGKVCIYVAVRRA